MGAELTPDEEAEKNGIGAEVVGMATGMETGLATGTEPLEPPDFEPPLADVELPDFVDGKEIVTATGWAIGGFTGEGATGTVNGTATGAGSGAATGARGATPTG